MFYCLAGKAVTKDDLFEGDILLTNANRYVVNGGDKHTSSVGKWPNGVVPYIFERSFGEKFCYICLSPK